MFSRISIFFVAFAVATAVLPIDEESKKEIDECVKESNIDLTKLANSKNWNQEFFDSHEHHCFAKCMALKKGTSEKDGTPNIGKLKELFKLKEGVDLESIAENCTKISVEGDDDCSKISKIQGCIFWGIMEPQMQNAYQLMEDVKKYSEECQKESGVNFDNMKENHTEILSGKEFKCFSKCMAVKFGTFDDQGEPNIDQMVKMSQLEDPSELKQAIEKCNKEVVKEEVCERVMETQTCIIMSMMSKEFGKKS